MSKPIKNLIVESYKKRFGDLDGAIVFDIRGLESNNNNTLRNSLADSQIKVTVVKNSLAKAAWKDTAIQGLCDMLDGSCAVAYGGESVVNIARALIDQAKTLDLQFRGAIMEGTVFGPDEIEKLSKYPTRDEALGQVIQVILGPAGQIIGAALSAGNNIASVLKTIEEKLEKGETIQKVG